MLSCCVSREERCGRERDEKGGMDEREETIEERGESREEG
jgi:hypothetical protein